MPRKQVEMKKLLYLSAAAALVITGCSERASDTSVVSAKTCGLCHDLPPRDSAHVYHVDTMHYRCSYCHGVGYEADSTTGIFTVNQSTHMNGDTEVVFTAPWDDSGRAVYDKSLKQCSNVYCHGGIPQGTHATVLWVGGSPINLRCYACHDSAGIATYHYGHARRAVMTGTTPCGGTVQQCYKCHGDSLSDTAYSISQPTRVDPVKHINGTFDAGTCRTCHSGEWATWQEYVATHPGATPFGKIMANGAPASMP
jgi:predicted CxxxxCH...CXXCH cytochrome family protein